MIVLFGFTEDRLPARRAYSPEGGEGRVYDPEGEIFKRKSGENVTVFLGWE